LYVCVYESICSYKQMIYNWLNETYKVGKLLYYVVSKECLNLMMTRSQPTLLQHDAVFCDRIYRITLNGAKLWEP
jgi:hypothetical protein